MSILCTTATDDSSAARKRVKTNDVRVRTVPAIDGGNCHMDQYVRNHAILSKNVAGLSIVQDNARSYSAPPPRMLSSHKRRNNDISPKTKITHRWESSSSSSSTCSITDELSPERWSSGEKKMLPRDIKRFGRVGPTSSRSPIDKLLMSSPAYMGGYPTASVIDNVKAALANDLSLSFPPSHHRSERRASISTQPSSSIKDDSRHALIRPNRIPSKESLPIESSNDNKPCQHDSHKQNMSWGSSSKVASTSLLPRSAFRKKKHDTGLSKLKQSRTSRLERNTTV